jgi:type I restriction enzyme R subunit
MSATPSFLEDHISQIPALQLLLNIGYVYLRPQEVIAERRGKLSNFLLEGVLEKQLRRLNSIRFKGSEYEFSDANIKAAIETLREVPFDGLVRTSERVYDLLSLGKSFEQDIEGDTKSFTMRYVDWQNLVNNVFHVAEEFEVERTGSHQTCRPDIVLFVNGIPFVVIECKRPDEKDSLKVAISQHLRNQDKDHIPRLFTFAQILLGINKNEAAYATTGTSAKFWSIWREETDTTAEVSRLVNMPLTKEQKDRLFADRLSYVRSYFEDNELNAREVTEQDRALHSLCLPERLLEIAYKFIVFEAGEKKIARYQQYFAVKNTLERIKHRDDDGRRKGGVIWHTQGSGKSLTMVMLAKAIALDPDIRNPKIVLVTDRVDLDDQLYRTFHHCGKEPVHARTGKHLMELLRGNKEAIIATTIFKFESGIKAQKFQDEGENIFVLVDESHRTQSGSRGEQYGKAHEKMRRVLPRACYIGFTGTPLMRKEKNTARQFGGFIDTYTIRRAVEDKAVVPLLYEGRHIVQEVDEKAIDKWFEIATKPLTPAQRADLKRKFSTADQLNKADRKIYLMAFDISEHFRQNWKGTGFKAQLTADSKASALKFKEYLDEFGQVTSDVLISGPDTREGNEDVDRVGTNEEQVFWKRMMDKYGSESAYNKQIINAFKHTDDPEIIIVVDKLLTGFDAPRNTVLYLARSLREHALLQAVARVNRLWEGKDFGYVIDYYGVLSELGEALELYGALPDFDREDLEDALTDIREEVEKLPQKHSELWDIFKAVKNRTDEEAYELELAREDVRQRFYTKLSSYSRALAIALSTVRFNLDTPEEKIDRYKKDLAFFQRLRVSVKKRYSDEIDYKEYEAKVQKLINTHVTSDEILQITPPVNIFEQEKFQAEVEKLQTAASKADTIAHRTKRTITEKMEEDPYFYRRFSKILEEAIEAYREQRISDAEYLSRVTEVMNSVVNRTGDDLPPVLKSHDAAKAFYGLVNEVFTRLNHSDNGSREQAAQAALRIDEIISRNKVVDWVANLDAQNAMRNEIDDYLYELRKESGIELSLDDMDLIVENSIDIAKARYA